MKENSKFDNVGIRVTYFFEEGPKLFHSHIDPPCLSKQPTMMNYYKSHFLEESKARNICFYSPLRHRQVWVTSSELSHDPAKASSKRPYLLRISEQDGHSAMATKHAKVTTYIIYIIQAC